MSKMSHTRILDHMNKDHCTSLHDYLEYYGGVHIDLDSNDTVELTDVKLNEMTIEYSKSGSTKSVVIPLRPPMSSMGEARVRFIRMAFEAANGLHFLPYRITDYVWPKSVAGHVELWGLGGALIVHGALASSTRMAKAAGYKGSIRRLRAVFWGLVATHLTEFFLFVVPRLRKLRGSRAAYLKTFVATMIGGFAGWFPLRAEVKRLAARRPE